MNEELKDRIKHQMCLKYVGYMWDSNIEKIAEVAYIEGQADAKNKR